MDLFQANAEEYYRRHAPLAERMRPRDLGEFAGQDGLVGSGSPLRGMIESDAVKSLVFWGPPGSGKTTLARIVATATGRRFVSISAVTSGVADVKRILEEARRALAVEQRGTLLFIDEIHRFNKAQQDALLHAVERGTVTLIGATTENPSFEINGALLSRLQVQVLAALDDAALQRVLQRALLDRERGIAEFGLVLDEGAEPALIDLAAGDARALLNYLELTALLARSRGAARVTPELVREAAGRRPVLYDKTGEEHYNVVSAFIKSMRGSDADAALYYLARMLEGGEAPEFVARRIVIFASEDVGNADPRALGLALACKDAVLYLGMPEAFFALSQCSVYLAAAPKSNSAGAAYARALEDVRRHGALPVPLHLRNAPTRLMEDLGYGRGYRYPHDVATGWVDADYLPERLRGSRYYRPVLRGFERRIAARFSAQDERRKTHEEDP